MDNVPGSGNGTDRSMLGVIKEGQGQHGCSRVSEGKRIGGGWQGCADHWKDLGFDSE